MAKEGKQDDCFEILQKCDHHKLTLTTYCKQERSVCCTECLKITKHSKCKKSSHQQLGDDPSLKPDTDFLSQTEKYISDEQKIASKMSNNKDIIKEKYKDTEAFHRYMIDMVDKLMMDMKREIDRLNSKAEDDLTQITVRIERTKTIKGWISNEVPLKPTEMSVACSKTEQYYDDVKEIYSNYRDYERQIQAALNEIFRTQYLSFKPFFDHYNNHKKTTASVVAISSEKYAQNMSEKNPGGQGRLQMQALKEKQRVEEASKQMLYNVYSNVIEMLEEYERRNGEKDLPQSKLDVTNHSWKTNEDVAANLDGQLVIFEAHGQACPSEVTSKVNTELRIKTIYWAAVREEKSIELSRTDNCIAHLYEILVRGSTHHKILEETKQQVTKETVKRTLAHIWKGKHEAAKIDNSFKQNPSKKASSPIIRKTSDAPNIGMGATRIAAVNPSLERFLKEDVAAVMEEIDDLK